MLKYLHNFFIITKIEKIPVSLLLHEDCAAMSPSTLATPDILPALGCPSRTQAAACLERSVAHSNSKSVQNGFVNHSPILFYVHPSCSM
jgi:hypothetical protein